MNPRNFLLLHEISLTSEERSWEGQYPLESNVCTVSSFSDCLFMINSKTTPPLPSTCDTFHPGSVTNLYTIYWVCPVIDNDQSSPPSPKGPTGKDSGHPLQRLAKKVHKMYDEFVLVNFKLSILKKS